MRKLNQVLVTSGIEVYREIVPVAVYSLISSIVLIPILLLAPVPFVLILLPLLYMPLVFGGFYAYHQRTIGKRSGVKVMLQGAAKGFFPSVIFGLFLSILAIILWSTWWYYGGRSGFLYLTIAVFQTYFVAAALISQFYTLQLVLQQGTGIFRAMGESVKLFFRYPVYTIGAFLQAAIVMVPLLLTVVGFAGLFTGMMSIYTHKAAFNALNPDADSEQEEDEGGDRI